MLLEAGLVRRTVVATDVFGRRDIGSLGGSGLLVPSRVADSLAGAIRPILEDNDLRTRLAVGLQARVLSESSHTVINPSW